MTDTPTTMDDLYPGGRGYHDAHAAYITAVADALDRNGFPVASHHAEADDPRDGAIQLDLEKQGVIDGKPVWPYDEVSVCWQEERGWHILAVDTFDKTQWTGKGGWQTDQRHVIELGVATVASPASVVQAVAEKAGLYLEVPGDGHDDLDFPDHQFEDDNPALEQALHKYAQGGGR